MKVRLGFVSNSSSSSFLVGVPVKAGDEVTQRDVREIFGIVPDSPIDKIIGAELAEMFLKNEYTVEKVLDDQGYGSMAEFFDDCCYGDHNAMKRELFSKLESGELRVFKLRGSNEDYEAVGQMLYNMDIEDQVTETGVYLVSEY